MTNRLPLAIIAAIFLFVTAVRASEKPDPNLLVKSANENSDLAKIVPHQFTGTVVLNPGARNESVGKITVYRDQDRYRTDIELAGQRHTRLIAGSKLYISNSSPIAFFGLEKLNDMENAWREREVGNGKMKYAGMARKKVLGMDAWCVNANYQDSDSLRLCFDATSQLMISTSYPNDSYEFSDFQEIDGQHYPGRIRRIKQGRDVLEVRDLKVQPGPVPQNAFEIPQGAREYETCDNIVPFKQISSPALFPHASFKSRESTKIFIYGIVGADGSFDPVQVTSIPRSPELIKLVEDGARKRRYSPAMCGTKPVAAEIHIEIETATPILR
jgi:hypothetical protein